MAPTAAGIVVTTMRIAVIAPLVTPLREAQLGGSQTALTELSRGLARGGDDVEVVVAPGSRVAGLNLRRIPGGPFPAALHRFWPPARTGSTAGAADAATWPALQAAAYLGIATDLRRRQPDVVHVHGFDWPAFYATAATGLPVVYSLHLGQVDGPAGAAAAAAARCRPRPLFVVPSRYTASAWRGTVPIDAVIPWGLDPESIAFSATPRDDLAIVAGRVSPEKGTHLALRAIRRAGMRALVVGPVYDSSYYRQRVVPLLGDRARWLGPVSRRRLATLYGRAAVAVVASLWEEPFGLVALEANFAGTPVAGFIRGGLPETVGGSGGVLSAEATVSGLVAAIRAAAVLDRASVRRRSVHRHSLSRVVERYRAVFTRAIAEHQRAPSRPSPGEP
jgi:glycosyltransferase involved in cell wall biosynthesis